jgi:hypothetical protein
MTFVSTQNWAQFDAAPDKEHSVEFDWNITVDQWSKYEEAFHDIKPLHGFISGKSTLSEISAHDNHLCFQIFYVS